MNNLLMRKNPLRINRGFGDVTCGDGWYYDAVLGSCAPLSVWGTQSQPQTTRTNSGGGWAGTVAQLGSQALSLLQMRLSQGNQQPFVTNINGRNYQISSDGTARDLGAAAGAAAGTLGAGISNFVQQNPLLVLGGGLALVLLMMKPPSRRR